MGVHHSLAADNRCPVDLGEVDVHILVGGAGHNLAEEAGHSRVVGIDHMPAEVAWVDHNLVVLVGHNLAVAVDHSLAEVVARILSVGHNHLVVQVRHTDQVEAHRNLVVPVFVRPVYHMNYLWHQEAI